MAEWITRDRYWITIANAIPEYHDRSRIANRHRARDYDDSHVNADDVRVVADCHGPSDRNESAPRFDPNPDPLFQDRPSDKSGG